LLLLMLLMRPQTEMMLMVNSSCQGFAIIVVASCRGSPGELFVSNASSYARNQPVNQAVISDSVQLHSLV